MKRGALSVAALAMAVAGLGCQSGEATAPAGGVSSVAAPIVNGQLESGYPAVGALTEWYGNQYGGSFCTATLIDPYWVITAAHCVEDASVSNTRFFVGPDASWTSSGNAPSNGSFYRAAKFVLQQAPNNYDPNTLVNDIALIQLSSPVPANVATPMAFNTTSLSPYQGQDALFIGYGQTTGLDQTGETSGPKRSVLAEISYVAQKDFRSDYNGTGTCFGDSGGPSIIKINGVDTVIGLTSYGEACQGWNCDPCKTASVNTRVDKHATWVANQIGAAPPDCRQDASICLCAEACGSNGACNDSVCAVATCAETYECLANCGQNQACYEGCMAAASEVGTAQVNDLLACFDAKCGNETTEQGFQTCAESKCGAELETCFGFGPVGTGNDTCDEVYGCLVGCRDNTCATQCYSQGTAEAQGQVDALLGCLDSNCANETTDQGFQTCAQNKCGAEVSACFGGGSSDPCDLTGGDCPAGSACYPTTDGSSGCFQTAGKAEGATCNPDANNLECVDGAACVGYEGETTGTCLGFCKSNADCGGATCDFALTGINGLGLCDGGGTTNPCTDLDGDGACADVDCNDNDATVKPGNSETCGNQRDDNCVGGVDEGCATGCVDRDADGACAEVDCNDDDPTIKPNGAERCGDAVDNDCDGPVDEDCTTCVDADLDGYCTPIDCNDVSASVNPTVAEICGNGIDDNCAGGVDENCGGTNPTNPNNPQPIPGGNNSDGCNGGGAMPLAALLALAGVTLTRRRRLT